jgi:hypothetical protein
MVRLVWRMCQVLTLNSHIVSSPVYDGFVVIGQLEDRQDFNVGKSCGEAPMPGWTPYSNEPVGWFVDSYSVRTYRPSDGDRPFQCTSDVISDDTTQPELDKAAKSGRDLDQGKAGGS